MVSRTAAQSNTSTDVRDGACVVKSIKAIQRTVDAPVLYLQIFNDGTAPVVGTDAPVHVLQVPAGIADHQGVYIKEEFQGSLGGKYLTSGLSYAVTTTHDGATAPDAGDEPEVEIHYENLG